MNIWKIIIVIKELVYVVDQDDIVIIKNVEKSCEIVIKNRENVEDVCQVVLLNNLILSNLEIIEALIISHKNNKGVQKIVL